MRTMKMTTTWISQLLAVLSKVVYVCMDVAPRRDGKVRNTKDEMRHFLTNHTLPSKSSPRTVKPSFCSSFAADSENSMAVMFTALQEAHSLFFFLALTIKYQLRKIDSIRKNGHFIRHLKLGVNVSTDVLEVFVDTCWHLLSIEAMSVHTIYGVEWRAYKDLEKLNTDLGQVELQGGRCTRGGTDLQVCTALKGHPSVVAHPQPWKNALGSTS